MRFICRHCDQLSDGEAYQVTSVENGMVMLDMIVCHGCALLARRLELPTRKIDLSVSNQAQVVSN